MEDVYRRLSQPFSIRRYEIYWKQMDPVQRIWLNEHSWFGVLA